MNSPLPPENIPADDPRVLNQLAFASACNSARRRRRRKTRLDEALEAIADELILEGIIAYDPKTVSLRRTSGLGGLPPEDAKNIIRLPRKTRA